MGKNSVHLERLKTISFFLGLVAIAAMMSGLLSKTVVSDFKAGFSETEVSGGHLSFHMFEKKM